MNIALRSPLFRYGALGSVSIVLLALLFPGFVHDLFSTREFMPHATCYLRNPKVIWLHVTSDALIGLSYVSISCTLGYLVYKGTRDIPFHWMFTAFGIFIISCGFTHFMEIWTVWQSVYWLAGCVKALTAVASVITAIALFPLVPKVFGLIESVKISERRRLELVNAHDELERSNADLGRQKAELEVINQELQMFTYSVAHDLRSPLRSMQNFAQVLIEDYGKQIDVQGQHHLDRIKVRAHKMEALLSDLLEYSRVSRGDLQLHPVSIEETLDQALLAAKPDIDARQARITLKGLPLRVVGNTSVVGQILTNLLSNAIKFVPIDATPEITITVEELGEFVRISVRDNGIGIEESQHERIFKIFERIHTDLEYAGTGVGLAIVQRATDKMSGRSGVNSKLGYGSTFWIELMKA